ncbi:multiple inositol polyphosphate phosphatase 1 [Ptiloglossa arizonensis]|uniref:multiple inositol polyphosphate phosphatase 1 n=1 Tax=Ptiloglossa arizonensis TaxID=3350558 RepID=UPI003FA033D7
MLDIRILTILVVFVSFENQLVLSNVETNYCYSTDEHPYLNAGTKTAYHYIHGLITNTSVPNCKPVQIWMLARHGTRNPGSDEIRNMRHELPKLQSSIIENHEKRGTGSLCKQDIENLKTWKINSKLTKKKSKHLTKQGKKDLKFLAERYKDYFPELLQYDSVDELESKYVFRATSTQRTVGSMNAFINGLFGNVILNNTEVVPTDEDTLLKIYKICKPWLESINNASTKAEVNHFLTGPVFNKTIHEISQRLGFTNDLSSDSVLIMYSACVFERAWFIDKQSPWCAAFTEDMLKVFEYEEDLYYYYYSSYGQKMSPMIGCTTLQDMFHHFTKLEKGDSSEPQGIFYFSHSTSLQLLLTTMGIAEDKTPLTAANFDTMKNSRKWRTSYLVPFGANIAAVFYRCDSSNKVRFFINEKPFEFEGCERGVCDWEYLKKKLGNSGYYCNIDFCSK